MTGMLYSRGKGMSSHVANLENGTGIFDPRTLTEPAFQVPRHGIRASRFMKRFAATLEKTQNEVAEYIERLAAEAFATGVTVFELTAQLYSEAPKLPSGAQYPMFEADLKRIHEHWRAASPKEVQSMRERLDDTEGVIIESTMVGDEESFPLRITLLY